MFEVLVASVKGILKCSDLDALNILEKRCAKVETSQVCYSELVACYEA